MAVEDVMDESISDTWSNNLKKFLRNIGTYEISELNISITDLWLIQYYKSNTESIRNSMQHKSSNLKQSSNSFDIRDI